eukprot:TRINITY_DN20760_c0_g1_i1.p1 TRINITY_DN20760_c0_g1~~TRINITY_DN20760_c0_g1_i1.p1  ORF type:complete len:572 (+),score=119.96 TRINITY_DN20760_c0_g1_i1:74-1789(+)
MPGGAGVSRHPPAALLGVGVHVFHAIVTCLVDFPRLACVSRAWRDALATVDVYVFALQQMHALWRPEGAAALSAAGWRECWRQRVLHGAWRPSKATMMVDFVSSVIDNLTNEEGTASQIYYTFPRVGLQFKRRFTLYGLAPVRNLTRVALKKGVHIRTPPCAEDAEFVATGQVQGRIVKLDFTTTSAEDGTRETDVVVWTSDGVELFTFPESGAGDATAGLTQAERKVMYSLCPRTSTRELLLEGHRLCDFLVLHINDTKVITALSCGATVLTAALSFYDFSTGARKGTTVVPGPIRAELSATSSDKGEWKSRERFDFKGSVDIGAVIDDDGIVQVYHFALGAWCCVVAELWLSWRGGARAADGRRTGPKPKYVRTAGNYVAIWNGTTNDPPYYVEVWQIVCEGRQLRPRQVLCECYSSISSVHIDETRCYVNATMDCKDVMVDTWDLVLGRFVSRVHSVHNAWSLEKQFTRTHLSKLFWSCEDCAIYYELNTCHNSGSVLSFRQLTCVEQDAYWTACKTLKGDDLLKRETYPIITTYRPQRALQLVWSDACVDEDAALTVTDFKDISHGS